MLALVPLDGFRNRCFGHRGRDNDDSVGVGNDLISTIDRGADAFGNPLQGDFHLRPYQTYDASVGVTRDNWNVELFGDNLSDERAQLYANASDRVLRITTNRPRTFGIRVSAKY